MIRVFVVEDHDHVRHVYRMLFKRLADVELVGMAASAEQALEELEPEQCDVAIVDISLPGMSGLELVARLRGDSPEMRLLVVTGHVEQRYAVAATEAGADGFVDKGDFDGLLDAIRACKSTEN